MVGGIVHRVIPHSTARLMPQAIDGLIHASLQHPVGGNLVLWRWNQDDYDVTVALRDRLGEAVAHPL